MISHENKQLHKHCLTFHHTDTMTYERPYEIVNGPSLLSRFDDLTKSGLVLYDENQKVVKHTDGDLEVR